MTDENKSYRVTDRRHFTRDGESVATEAGDAEPQPLTVDDASDPSSGGGGEPPADLIALVVSLGTQASVLLGGAEGVAPDLKGARWLISILEMLKDKTEGRRTRAETEALETLLYELRMAYVQRTRTGGV
jgi:hypothetical protein